MMGDDRARRAATYAAAGCVADIAFSAVHDVARKRPLRLRTSAWMLPVYGLIQPLYEPLHIRLRNRSSIVRGATYGTGFLIVEYATGKLLRKLRGAAPWDYSEAALNVDGLIRVDYVFLWAAFGLALEPLHDHLIARSRL